ncbi:Gfo/Idh/MocA family protein, partial [Thermodesulfobacteriota bacterium]
MNQVRVAVVGVGYLGAFHAEKAARMPGASLVACVDVDGVRAREIAGRHGCRAETDYAKIIGDVDAVCLAVPTSKHHAIARDLLVAGVDVLVEKPMAINLDECDELIEIAEREGRILQVGHVERFNPAVIAVEGRIDAPLFIESHRLSPYRERGTEVDVVLDLMIHDLD